MGLGKSSKLILMVMGFFLFASWIIALAGLSAMQNQVNADWAFSLQWFILFLQLAVGIAFFLLAATGYLRKCSTALMTYLGILSTLWLLFAYQAYSAVRSDVIGSINIWLGASFRTDSVDTARYNTWIVGSSFLFIFNFVAILLLSLDLEDDKELVSTADPLSKVPSTKTVPKYGAPKASTPATPATPAGVQPFSGPTIAPPSRVENV